MVLKHKLMIPKCRKFAEFVYLVYYTVNVGLMEDLSI